MSKPVRLPSISYVVARSYPHNIIGRDNRLPWHLRTDLRRFKAITMGGVVVMGRNTFLSIGRPLPGRTNIVLSKRMPNDPHSNIWTSGDTSLLWADTLETAMYLADIVSLANDRSEFFIIGGEQMYKLFQKFVNRVHLTQVFMPGDPRPTDARFSFDFDGRKWRIVHEEEIKAGPDDQYPTRYEVWDRKIRTVRYVELASFFTCAPDKSRWIAEQFEQIEAPLDSRSKSVREHQLGMFERLDPETTLSV